MVTTMVFPADSTLGHATNGNGHRYRTGLVGGGVSTADAVRLGEAERGIRGGVVHGARNGGANVFPDWETRNIPPPPRNGVLDTNYVPATYALRFRRSDFSGGYWTGAMNVSLGQRGADGKVPCTISIDGGRPATYSLTQNGPTQMVMRGSSPMLIEFARNGQLERLLWNRYNNEILAS